MFNIDRMLGPTKFYCLHGNVDKRASIGPTIKYMGTLSECLTGRRELIRLLKSGRCCLIRPMQSRMRYEGGWQHTNRCIFPDLLRPALLTMELM